jgi:hypothetical protein
MPGGLSVRLLYEDSENPEMQLCVADRLDGDAILSFGDTFEVTEEYGRQLLAHYFPRVRPAPNIPPGERPA